MSTDDANKREGWRITGRAVLAVMVGFFGIIFSANALMIWLATSTHTGIVVDSAWRSGGNWQREIESARAQETLGWSVEVEIARNGAGADVVAAVIDSAGAPVDGIDLNLRLVSPTGPAGDQFVTLRAQDAGLYAGTIDRLPAGRWQVLVDAESALGRIYRSQNTVLVR